MLVLLLVLDAGGIDYDQEHEHENEEESRELRPKFARELARCYSKACSISASFANNPTL